MSNELHFLSNKSQIGFQSIENVLPSKMEVKMWSKTVA